MRTIDVLLAGPADFTGWRNQARRLLAAAVPPEAIEWRVPGEAPGLFVAAAVPKPAGSTGPAPTLPHRPLDLSEERIAGDLPRNVAPGAAESTDHPPPTASRPSADLSERRAVGGTTGSPAGTASDPAADANGPPPIASRVFEDLSEQRPAGKTPAPITASAAPDPAADAHGPPPTAPRASTESSERRPVHETPAPITASAAPDPAADAIGPLPIAPRAFEDPSERPMTGEARASFAVPAPDMAVGADRPTPSAPHASDDPSVWREAGRAPGYFAGPAPDAVAGTECPPPTAPRASPGLSEPPKPSETPADRAPGAAPPPAAPTVPRAFVDLSERAIRHRDPERFALLYRVLWRLTHGEPALMRVATDPDIARLAAMEKAVRRDAHKMHAFVRFREIRTEDGPRFVSWFEPEHHIVEAEAGFFVRRFAGMRWSILTPEASAHWDGAALTIGPGARRADAPAEDAHEDLWRAYYSSVFNPARLKPDAMRAEMPVKYWPNLPEARVIGRLIAEAPRRAAAMVERGASAPAVRRQRNVHLPTQPAAASDVTEPMPAADLFTAAADPAEALAALRAEMLALNSLPPWTADSTQMVFGEGPVGAPLLFVGEQPGDEEDIAGRPFVGPAGRMFNKALEEAGVPRNEAYVTNAVKHFKFKPTGRRRLHQSPDAGDIAYYRPFLKREIDLVGPQLVVTLGATALRAMSGKPLAIGKTRGEVMPMADGPPIFPTVHPSYLLRLPDPDSKAREYERFIADLKRAYREVA